MFASVTIDVNNNAISDTYTYRIPEELEGFVNIGSRVLVEFGVNKTLGYVIEIKENSEYEGNTKDIVEVLDYSQELTIEQIELAKSISVETKCHLIKALEVMYPSFLKSKHRKFLEVKNFLALDPNIALLFNNKTKICLTAELLKEYPKIRKEITNRNLELTYDVFTYGKRKMVKLYYVNTACEHIYSKYEGVKKEVVNFVLYASGVTFDQIKENVGCSNYLINALMEREVLYIKETFNVQNEVVDKAKLQNTIFPFIKQEVKDKFTNMSNKPFLLYSNDENFNLELYLDICKDNIRNNKTVLIVTPTLINNYSIFNYLKRNLHGYGILNFSSDLPNNEFYENYMRLREGIVDVVVTTKVGAFVPLENIGTIIAIDISNFNYINETTPKFDTIELLKQRAVYHKCKIILSSNPLTIEGYYNYFAAKYNILKYIIPQDHNVKLVDMKDEIIEDNAIISKDLINGLKNTLDNKKQAMLILNAKGYANHLVCRSCGKVCLCEKCNIPMTYYKEKNEVRCRYCGSKLNSWVCSCGNDNYSMFGFGLEMVEEKLKELFPEANVLMINSDTMKDYRDYQRVVIQIESRDVDIIIGTNAILPLSIYSDVALTCLLSADNLLNTSDYKASYNTFYLICNALKTSDLIIQGYNLDHYAIKYGINADFVAFYNEEIKVREAYNYPPYYEISRLIITGDYSNMYHCANYFKKVYGNLMGNNNLVLGPVYVKIRKGVQLIIKHKDFTKLSKLIDEVEKKFVGNNIYLNFERFPRSLY